MDPHSSQTVAFLQDSVNHLANSYATYNGGHTWTYIFHDNSDEVAGDAVNGTPTQPCDYKGQQDLAQANLAAYNHVALPTGVSGIILNTLGLPTAFSKPPADDTIANLLLPLQAPVVAGGMLEDFIWGNKNPSGYNTLTGTGSSWQSQEDMQIATVRMGKIFEALENGPYTSYETTNPPNSALGVAARTYVYASTLLTYDPKLTQYGQEIKTTSGWMNFPEEGLVPMYPVIPAASVSSVLTLQRGINGPYVREYLGCYYRGSYVGPCAVVVNPSTNIVAVSLPAYQHSMVLTGTDIIDGGTATFAGPAVTSLGPTSAAILFP